MRIRFQLCQNHLYCIPTTDIVIYEIWGKVIIICFLCICCRCFRHSDLEIGEVLGQGFFGRVLKVFNDLFDMVHVYAYL